MIIDILIALTTVGVILLVYLFPILLTYGIWVANYKDGIRTKTTYYTYRGRYSEEEREDSHAAGQKSE